MNNIGKALLAISVFVFVLAVVIAQSNRTQTNNPTVQETYNPSKALPVATKEERINKLLQDKETIMNLLQIQITLKDPTIKQIQDLIQTTEGMQDDILQTVMRVQYPTFAMLSKEEFVSVLKRVVTEKKQSAKRGSK